MVGFYKLPERSPFFACGEVREVATQWWRIKKAYLEGEMTYGELAEKYKLSERTIRNRASKEGWGKEKDKIETEVGEAIHTRAVRARVEQLEALITANERMASALEKLTAEIEENPDLLLGEKRDGKAADAISKAIQTTIMSQRDLYKLPTLDQDMAKARENQRKREAKAKMALEKEKWQLEKAQAELVKSAEAVKIQVTIEGDETQEDLEG
jgi:hypothetical protein